MHAKHRKLQQFYQIKQIFYKMGDSGAIFARFVQKMTEWSFVVKVFFQSVEVISGLQDANQERY